MSVSTDIEVHGVKFYLSYDDRQKVAKLFGPKAPGYAWEGPLIGEIAAPDFYAAIQLAQSYVERSLFDGSGRLVQ